MSYFSKRFDNCKPQAKPQSMQKFLLDGVLEAIKGLLDGVPWPFGLALLQRGSLSLGCLVAFDRRVSGGGGTSTS